MTAKAREPQVGIGEESGHSAVPVEERVDPQQPVVAGPDGQDPREAREAGR